MSTSGGPFDDASHSAPTPEPLHSPEPVHELIEPHAAGLDATLPLRVVTPAPATLPASTSSPLPVAPAPAARPMFRFGGRVSSLVSRLLAYGVDLFVVGGVIAVSAYSLVDQNPLTGMPLHDEGGFDLTLGFAFAMTFVYVWVCEALLRGTIGKLLFGLMVSSTSGRAPGFVRAFVRSLLRPLDILIIGPFLALVTPRRQRLGDLLGGTVVSRSPLGPVAPLIAIVLLFSLVAFQWTLGGGWFSLATFSASALDFGPKLVAHAAAWIGSLLPRSV